jgi:hypothetical protein
MALAAMTGCRAPQAAAPSIAFTIVPDAGEGGSQKMAPIAGRVTGAARGQRIVLFAKSGVWWVQPFVIKPFTEIGPDGTWKSETHLGTDYAALLVDQSYQAPGTIANLPAAGGPVSAVATTPGRGAIARPPAKTLQFSGYEWEIRQTPSNRGGDNLYEASNAWVDASGHLHLRIARRGDDWTCGEVSLTRSLGYGTYSFVVRDTTHMDPAAALSINTWDNLASDQNHREFDIEISRWGDPANKDAQYLIQPYYVPANVFRFAQPPGRLTHAIRWEPGRLSFKTTRPPASTAGAAPADPRVVAARDFASGVPSPGGEQLRLSLYVFRYAAVALRNETEVVIEKFEYLP